MVAPTRLWVLASALAFWTGCSVEPPMREGQTAASVPRSIGPTYAGDAPVGTSGCGQAPVERGVSTRKIAVRGVERSFVLSVPSSYESQRPHRLVFGWHGLGLSGAQMRSFVSAIEALAGDDALFVYPDASINGGTRRLDGRANGPDVAFFDALLQSLGAAYCIDTRRIFSIGFSDGGFFTNALAQAREGALRGIVSIAGGGGGGRNMAAMVIHSQDDANVGIGYGIDSVRQWGAANACRSEDFGRYPLGVCRPLTDCREGYPVVFCRWGRTSPDQGTHDWPRFASANQDIWDFIRSP